jgi:hypothetical protein
LKKTQEARKIFNLTDNEDCIQGTPGWLWLLLTWFARSKFFVRVSEPKLRSVWPIINIYIFLWSESFEYTVWQLRVTLVLCDDKVKHQMTA